MKIILFVSFLLSINAYCAFNIGVKAGFNYNNIITDDMASTEEVENNYSYQYGIFFNLNYIDKLFIQSEFNINRKGFIHKTYYDDTFSDNVIEYLEIPIIAGYKTDFGLYFFVGKYFSKYIESYSFSENYETGKKYEWTGKYDPNSDFPDKILGFILGIGYNYKNYIIELRYNKTITKIDLDYESGGKNPDRLYQFSLLIGGYINIF